MSLKPMNTKNSFPNVASYDRDGGFSSGDATCPTCGPTRGLRVKGAEWCRRCGRAIVATGKEER